MNGTDFFNELTENINIYKYIDDRENKRKIYNNKEKDVKFIKKILREKVNLDGSVIYYFPIKKESAEDAKLNDLDFDNILGDHTHLEIDRPIRMMATWTPQEYKLDLSKWGVIMPEGSDQQLYIHVDELEEKLKRKPMIGDIIETEMDRKRYKISDVYYGHANLWENIFCMVTLTKITRDNYTVQLDKYEDYSDRYGDEKYSDTYVSLETKLDIGTGEEKEASNYEIKKKRKKTRSKTVKKEKESLDTELQTNDLDLMTMKL